MQPPYEITAKILKLITSISEKLGEVNAAHLHKPSPELRKRNRIKTIQSSLQIEGNTLSEEQITALFENKRVIGPQKDILEVLNAIEVYKKIDAFEPTKLKSFLKAHKILMTGLIPSAGKLRTRAVGIVKGEQVSHLAPPAANVHYLMTELLKYLKKSDDLILIKSCVFHYEMEFIHPFMDGNGRMGRLWQTLILLQEYPVFEFLPLETIIKEKQNEYYRALEISDRAGNSTQFIEFMLEVIDEALNNLLSTQTQKLDALGRINYFQSITQKEPFSRKDYLNYFKEISSATASRDLKKGVDEGILKKEGDKRLARYRYI